MDKKKTLISSLVIWLIGAFGSTVCAQSAVSSLQFCDRIYNYGVGNDTIHLCFKLYDDKGAALSSLKSDEIRDKLYLYEDGKEIKDYEIKVLDTGIRIPKGDTYSVLLDQNLPKEVKQQTWEVLEKFVAMAPDSSIYLSYYGDGVSLSWPATKKNMEYVHSEFMKDCIEKQFFYSAVYSKLIEFTTSSALLDKIQTVEQNGASVTGGYEKNTVIASRAAQHNGRNILILFVDGTQNRDFDDRIETYDIEDIQKTYTDLPQIYAYYYTNKDEEPSITNTLYILTSPKDENNEVIESQKGVYKVTSDSEEIISDFEEVIEDAAYDYELIYIATTEKTYTGNVNFKAKWGRSEEKTIGEATYAIGAAENPWPNRPQQASGLLSEIIVAAIVTLMTFIFFFLVIKVIVPYIRSLIFKAKYYKAYKPEDKVQRRICHYCKQEIRPGQIIVTRCNHWMHEHCWKENGYKCAEYGQNCKTGMQEHVEWKSLFSWTSLKDSSQTLSGIIAGLVSWIIYETCGRGALGSFAEHIVGLVFDKSEDRLFYQDCVVKTSSFLLIGLLLAFFTSFVFRYNDDVRDKNVNVCLKIVGLSLMTSIIGMFAFAVGADFFCLMVSWTNSVAWYNSLPAYILFSLSVSLALTVSSTIPIKSALTGGVYSSAIGFVVLYFSHFVNATYSYLPMLLDFVIYGGGLGFSLITVRMLAERYFLVIQNGVKAGQRIPIHKWMNATGGGKKVSIGMTGDCEIQMNWEKSNKVAKEHAQLFIDHEKMLPVIKPLATNVIFNNRAELQVNSHCILSNGDTFKIGDTIFKYEEKHDEA